MKCILVTGGCGFIASHVIRHLLERYSYRIINVDRLDECGSLHNCDDFAAHPNYTFVRGDVASVDLLRYVFKTNEIDTVLHAAAHTHVDNSFGNSLQFTLNNVYGTHVLLEAAREAGVRRFVHVSTDEVYGSCDERKEEGSVLDPTNPYAASKAAAEQIVRSYVNSFGFPAIITRGNNVYGPCQYPEKLIPKFALRLLRGRKCRLHGSGENRRHFVHVRDVAAAFVVILHKGVVGETYNIGTTDEFRNVDIARRLVGVVKPGELADDWIEHVVDRPFNDVRYHLSFEKLAALGWAPQTDFTKGLEETVEWYRQVDPAAHWSARAVDALL